jgi:hypothetical protein
MERAIGRRTIYHQYLLHGDAVYDLTRTQLGLTRLPYGERAPIAERDFAGWQIRLVVDDCICLAYDGRPSSIAVFSHTGRLRWRCTDWRGGDERCRMSMHRTGMWTMAPGRLCRFDWETGERQEVITLANGRCFVQMHLYGDTSPHPHFFSVYDVIHVVGGVVRRGIDTGGVAPAPENYRLNLTADNVGLPGWRAAVQARDGWARRAELMLRLQRRLPPDLQRMVVEYID